MKRLITVLTVLMLSTMVFAAPWDFLRPAVELAQNLDAVVSFVVLLASLAMVGVAGMALKIKSSKKLKLVFVAFALFFVKLLLNFADLYISPGRFMNNAILGVFDLAILVALFVAIFRK